MDGRRRGGPQSARCCGIRMRKGRQTLVPEENPVAKSACRSAEAENSTVSVRGRGGSDRAGNVCFGSFVSQNAA